MSISRSAWLVAATIVLLGLAAASCTSRRPMNAPWCYTSAETSNMHCEYETLKQCQATLAGLGGVCGPNPRYGRTPDDAPPPRRR